MKAALKQIRLSPKKANLVAWIIRWMDVAQALSLLENIDKKWAKIIYVLLSSAVANAITNDAQNKWDLYVSKIMVTEWPTYKRWRSRSKWRVFKILKRTSHIFIELWVKELQSSKTPAKQPEPETETVKEEKTKETKN